MSNGKGSKPRNCFSKQFKDNYEKINWSKSPTSAISGAKAGFIPDELKFIPSRMGNPIISLDTPNVSVDWTLANLNCTGN